MYFTKYEDGDFFGIRIIDYEIYMSEDETLKKYINVPTIAMIPEKINKQNFKIIKLIFGTLVIPNTLLGLSIPTFESIKIATNARIKPHINKIIPRVFILLLFIYQ